MITITPSLVRQLRTVCRRAGIKFPGRSHAHVDLHAHAAGLTIRAVTSDTIIEYHQLGALPDEQLIVPFNFLTDCEGSKNDPVALEGRGDDKIIVTWTDQSIPQLIEYPAQNPQPLPAASARAETLVANEPGLWQALHDASQVTDNLSTRYALGYIQLRASDGRVAATDGRQVYVQSGFQFPWPNEVLIPGSSLFACRELPQDQPVLVGQAGDWVTLALGPWTFRFCQPKDARFPQLDDILQGAEPPVARLQVSPADAQFLMASLPRLPGSDTMHDPVTLDLNGKVVVRARSTTDAAPTELIATNSRVVGDGMLLATNRKFLVHALRLGFREIGFKTPNTPALCLDGNRRYLWALLGPDGAIRASDQAVRIESPVDTGSRRHANHSISRRTPTMSNSNTTHESAAPVTEQASASKPTIHRSRNDDQVPPIEQVVALRNQLRETVNQTNELIRSLKRQKKQSRLVASTLASLKELQKVAG